VATTADLNRIAPDFASLDPATVLQPFLTDAALEIDPKAWGQFAERVTCLLAAHALAVSYPNLYQRPVQEDHAGPTGSTYVATVTPRADEYGTTRFGLEYLRLRSKLMFTFGVV
jgi:hypothetical protein